jgi:hypothetical protein
MEELSDERSIAYRVGNRGDQQTGICRKSRALGRGRMPDALRGDEAKRLGAVAEHLALRHSTRRKARRYPS